MDLFDENLYDEFGNYIGPERPTAVQREILEEDEPSPYRYTNHQQPQQRIVLHEDKQYFLTTHQVYGPDVQTLVQDEDTQLLTEPVVAPVRVKRLQLVEPKIPGMRHASPEYLSFLMQERASSVAVVGHLHHGKTALMDMLVKEALLDPPRAKMIARPTQTRTTTNSYDPETGIGGGTSSKKPLRGPHFDSMRYTDSLFVERERGTTLKAKPIALPLPNSKGCTRLIHFMDTPGHMDFLDEAVAAVNMCDRVILVVDVVEGLMPQSEAILKHAMEQRRPLTLVLNKIERLALELKLPPMDAFFKLKHTIESINTHIGSAVFAPEQGNVVFATTGYGVLFSLVSFSRLYCKAKKLCCDPGVFAARLWGDIVYEPETGQFLRSSTGKRTFVTFVLEPLYKLMTQVLGEEEQQLQRTLTSLGIRLESTEYSLDTKTLLKLVLQRFLGTSTAPLMDAVFLSGEEMHGKEEKPLFAFVGKMYPVGDGSSFEALAKIYSGTISRGDTLYVCSGPDELQRVTCGSLFLPGAGRYKIEVDRIGRGNLVLISGLDTAITKTAILVDTAEAVMEPPVPRHVNEPALKVSIEPINPSDLPQMLQSLRRVNQSYPALQTRVEDSGEHVITGCGELYLDCVLHDLRRTFSPVPIEIKVADPVVRFNETVVDMSYIKCFADTPNRHNRVTIIAEPLEESVANAIERGLLQQEDAAPQLMALGWDKLAVKGLWAVGPDPVFGPNVLLNDTFPDEVDQAQLLLARDAIIQGFQWACREGPVAEEPIRNVKFRLVYARIAPEPIHRGSGQLVPTARRACYSAFLTASPRLLEPMYAVYVQTPKEFMDPIFQILAKRRGHVVSDVPLAGTTLYQLRALLPVLDSVGFETDIRVNTQGMAHCQASFSHWQVVPGDPIDNAIKIIPLEPSPAPVLARDCTLKTRRRKGLSEDVSPNKFFDPAMLEHLHHQEHRQQAQQHGSYQ